MRQITDFTVLHIDFETYYDREFSLSKMPTLAYVRDQRFNVFGCAVALNDEPSVYLEGEAVREYFDSLDTSVGWDKIAVSAYNCAFDATVLFVHYGKRPAFYIDPLSAARALLPMDKHPLKIIAPLLGLGEKGDALVSGAKEASAGMAAYATNDNDLARGIYEMLYPMLTPEEHYLIHIHIRQAAEPTIVLDREVLTQVRDDAIKSRDALIAASGYTDAQLSSNPQFAQIIRDLGLTPPTKISSTTGEETDAFAKGDDEFVEFMLAYPEYKHIWDGRLAAKSTINQTRAEKFLTLASLGDGTVGMPLNYCGAHTGRSSGADSLNVQNLPSKYKSNMRKAFTAPKGYVIVVVDSSQIELRLNMWLSGQYDKLDLLRNGGCIYAAEAMNQFGIISDGSMPTKQSVTTEQRQFGKVVQLGCLAEGTSVLVLDKNASIPYLLPIQYITTEQLLWDGEQWVQHQGLVNSGIKQTFLINGVWMTADHKVLSSDNQWIEAEKVAQNVDTQYQVSVRGMESLRLLGMKSVYAEGYHGSSSNVPVGRMSMESTRTILSSENLLVATSVLNELRQSLIAFMRGLYPISSTDQDWETVSQLLSNVVITHPIEGIKTMAVEGLRSILSGLQTDESFWRTLLPWMVGILQSLNWIELTTTEVTSREIYDLLLKLRTSEIGEQSSSLSKRLQTYDIALAGTNNRFTVVTHSIPMVVHNCGYGMGATKFRKYAAAGPLGLDPIYMSQDEAFDAIMRYRTENHMVPALWRTLDDMIMPMTVQSNQRTYKVLEFGHESIMLPSGRSLMYPGLTQTEEGSWVYGIDKKIKFLWGGTLSENCLDKNTKVLTLRGVVPIVEVNSSDRVWDGVSWVLTEGCISRGKKEVGVWLGVTITSDHKIFDGKRWRRVIDLTEDCSLTALEWARDSVHSQSSLAESEMTALQSVYAIAGQQNSLIHGLWRGLTGLSAMLVLGGNARPKGVSMQASSRQKNSVNDGNTFTQVWSAGVQTLSALLIKTTAVAASKYAMNGSVIEKIFSGMLLRYRAMTICRSISIERITKETTNRGMLGSFLAKSMLIISGIQCGLHTTNRCLQSRISSAKYYLTKNYGLFGINSKKGCRQNRLWMPTGKKTEVFDLLNCGPNTRFTIITNEGPVVVHNCIQALARDVVFHQMVEIDQRYRVLSSTHDEVLFLAPESEAEEALAFGLEVFSQSPSWAPDLPVCGEGDFGHWYSK